MEAVVGMEGKRQLRRHVGELAGHIDFISVYCDAFGELDYMSFSSKICGKK